MKKNKVFAIAMTVLWCVVFANAMHDRTPGICMGLCMGVAFGLFDGWKDKLVAEEEPEDVGNKFREDLFPVRILDHAETGNALQLAWKVFSEFEVPDYAPEGAEEFRKCLNDEAYLAGIRYYGAYDGEKLVGILGVREDSCHICFFFVEGEYQRRGIGTGLFLRMREDFPGRKVTLNSSPYGLPFYRALGFRAMDSEQTVNGIRFTPMEYVQKND